MFCLYCGNKLPDNALFCNQCGRGQNTTVNPVDSSYMTPAAPPMTNISTDGGQVSSGTMPFAQEPPPESYSIPTTLGTSSILGSGPREPGIATRPAQPVSTQPTFRFDTNAGSIIAGIGGVVGLLSFFFMPYLSYGFITATGQQLASFGYQYSSGYYGSSQQQFNGLLYLWLLPVIAGIIVLIAVVQLFSSGGAGKKAAGGWLIALAVLAILGLLGAYIYLTAQIQNSTSSPVTLTSLIGSGIWVYIIAMIASIVGGILQIRTNQ